MPKGLTRSVRISTDADVRICHADSPSVAVKQRMPCLRQGEPPTRRDARITRRWQDYILDCDRPVAWGDKTTTTAVWVLATPLGRHAETRCARRAPARWPRRESARSCCRRPTRRSAAAQSRSADCRLWEADSEARPRRSPEARGGRGRAHTRIRSVFRTEHASGPRRTG